MSNETNSKKLLCTKAGEATWVPTLEETDQLYETLGMTNFYNLNKQKIPQLKEQC